MKNLDMCPIDILETIVYQERQSLEKYRNRPQAKQAYIIHREKFISSLELAVSLLKGIKYLRIWQMVDHRIQESEDIDPSLTGHTIHMRTKSGIERTSFLNIDLQFKKRRKI